MKTIKKLSILALAIGLLIPVTQSCKKGEEDPGLSLKSRKGRLAGEWTVASLEETKSEETKRKDKDGNLSSTLRTTHNVFDGQNSTNTRTTTYKGNYYNYDNPYGKDTVIVDTYKMSGSSEYVINKDGTFSKTENWNKVETTNIIVGTTIQTIETTINIKLDVDGTWDFNDGIGDVKGKSKVSFYFNKGKRTEETIMVQTDVPNKPTNTIIKTEEYTNTNTAQEVWDLVMLKNKEIKATRHIAYTSNVNTSWHNSASNKTEITTSETNNSSESTIMLTAK